MCLDEIYNSEFAVKEYVTNLKTLHEICTFRHNKGYNKNERMREFKILDGFIWLDTCGNAMVRIGKDQYSPIRIPKEESVCPVCGKTWSIYTIEDYVTTYDYSEEKAYFYHKQCNFINNLNKKLKQFTEIFNTIYPNEYSFRVAPNEYCRCELCAPWFVFSVPHGDIKIGWRKRVINIEWLNTYAMFSERFDNEDVTKRFNHKSRGIHAWNIEKCIEYLQRAKESIIK